MIRRSLVCWIAAVLLGVSAALAQTEPQELDPTSVVLTQPPPTTLDAIDQNPGLSVRTLTKIGDVPDDAGGTISVFAVRIEQPPTDPQGKPALPPAAGLALVVTPRGGRPVRAYVDAGEIDHVTAGLTAITASAERPNGPLTETRAVYRYANLAVYQFDDAGGRTVAVRTLQVAPITGQANLAVARFRSPRLPDVVRLLRQGKATLDKPR